MFRRLSDDDVATIRFDFDGRSIEAREGDSIAAALLAAGILQFRETPVSGSPRGPYCLMGVCFDCLVEIDGVPNRRACQESVRASLQVRPQHGVRTVPQAISQAIPQTASQLASRVTR
jgi:predicted molibdopterin-dependent oxidoreductase YjgC